jgi:Lauroyl/myristoyl acyltransferase
MSAPEVGGIDRASTGKAQSGGPAAGTVLWQRLVLALMRGAGSALSRISRPASVRFGTRLGGLAFRLARRQRQRADANLRLAYGETLSAPERLRLARGVFEHFGRSVVEFLRGPLLSAETLAGLVEVDGWEHVEQALAEKRGVVLVTAHLGNWEVLGRWLATVKGLPLTVVAREPENPSFARYVRGLRENAGFRVLNKGASARELLRVLKRGDAICLLPDQNSGDVFVPFFGVPAGTVAGPASLALHTGAALIPLFCFQTTQGDFRIVCRPPQPVEASGDHEADVRRIMSGVNAELELAVRSHPEQWLWLHDRWKSSFETKNRGRAWPVETGFENAYALWRSGRSRA